MKKLRNYVAASTGFVLFVFVIALAIPQMGRGSMADEKDVFVVNTSAEPIPVSLQGSPVVSGSVSVSNTPTVHLDSNQVSVQGPVEVNGTVGTRPSRNGAFTVIKRVFPENSTVQAGPFPAGTQISVSSLSLFNENGSVVTYGFGAVDLGPNGTDCSNPASINTGMIFSVPANQSLHLPFPHGMVFPPAPTTQPWCVSVQQFGSQATDVSSLTILTGFLP